MRYIHKKEGKTNHLKRRFAKKITSLFLLLQARVTAGILTKSIDSKKGIRATICFKINNSERLFIMQKYHCDQKQFQLEVDLSFHEGSA